MTQSTLAAQLKHGLTKSKRGADKMKVAPLIAIFLALTACILENTANANVCVTKRLRISKVQGIVLDSSGESIFNAKVSLRSKTNKEFTPLQALTDSVGRYQFDGVVPGDYEITIETLGFTKAWIPLRMSKSGCKACELVSKLHPFDFCENETRLRKHATNATTH